MKNTMTTSFGNTIMNTQRNQSARGASGVLASILVAAFAATGCGEAIDISHVGPNVVDKKIFQGEWYFRTTVVDKQSADPMHISGEQGGTERIRWEITETELIAHRSYEKVIGADPTNPGDENVIAAFPIKKHFDIKRGYNPVNGVETNVIEENDYDRPWWQRDYMRVDWSKNVAQTFNWLTGNLEFCDWSSGTCVVRNAQTVNHDANNDPTYPWKIRISDNYIETTLDSFVEPDPYLCYYLDGVSPCNGSMAKVKLAFMKVDPANDYVAFNYPDFSVPQVGQLHLADQSDAPIFASVATTTGQLVPRMCTSDEVGPDGTGVFSVVEQSDGNVRMCNPDPFRGDEVNGVQCKDVVAKCENMAPLSLSQDPADVTVPCNTEVQNPDDCFQFSIPMFERFGFFRTDRYVDDRENGFTLAGRERLINRWNVWQKSHDAAGNVLPMAQRTPKPIIYYKNVNFPPELADAAKALESDWDQGFRQMIASAQGKKFTDITTQMFFIKDNDCNVKNVNDFAAAHGYQDALKQNGIGEVGFGNLESACAVLEDASQKAHLQDPAAPIFTWQQLGDLRYSFVNWTIKPEFGAGGLLGLANGEGEQADPITGEIFSATANIYGASIDTYANWGADIVDLLNGKITDGDIINGTQIRTHVETVRNRWRSTNTPAQVTGFLKLFDNRTAHMSDDQYLVKVPATAMNANWDKIAQSDLEEQFIVTSEMARLFGNDYDSQSQGVISDKMLQNARPSTWMRNDIPQLAYDANTGVEEDSNQMVTDANIQGMAGKYEAMADYLGRTGHCYLAGQVEPAVADLAARLKDANLTHEQVVEKIRESVFVAVTAHELGHTFGLRHNFQGSADPMNFFPAYWGVDKTALDADHQHLFSKSEEPCTGGPGDPLLDSSETASAHCSEQQYSSIMDYHQRFNSDWGGVGLYDKAAIKFGYANMVEIFDESETNGNFVSRDWIDNIFLLDPYTLPYLVAGDTDTQTGGSTADDKIGHAYDAVINGYNGGDQYAVLDIGNNSGLQPHPENIYKRRDIPMKDWLRNETLRNAFTGSYDNIQGLQNAGLLDDDGRAPKVSVPYGYCSDAYAWGGGLTCNRFDMGVTSTDIVTNAGQMYEFYYPFQAFRGQKVLANQWSWPYSYMNRLYDRTYQPMLNAFRYFYFYRRSSAAIFPAVRDWANASLVGMNFFARVLQTPDTGIYCKNSAGEYVPQAQSDNGCADSFTLGLDEGRVYDTNWDFNYEFRPLNIGNFWDKALAIRALTDSDGFFFRDFSNLTNRGSFSIGYYRVFQPEMLKLFGGLMSGDASDYTPRIVADASNGGAPKIIYQPFVQTDVYGQPIPPDPSLAAGDPILPAQSYDLRTQAGLIAMVNLSSTLDQTMDFAQRARITIAGSQSDPVHSGGVPQAEFRDPSSGTVYHAYEIDGPDSSVGFRLLNEAKTVADGPWTTAKNALDAVQADPNATPSDVDAAQTAFDVVDAQLQEKVQLIDFLVYAGNILEYNGG